MSRYVIEGMVWWAGDNVYIETERRGPNGLPTEVCLNDLIRDHIKENSKITIVIDVEKPNYKRTIPEVNTYFAKKYGLR